VKLIVVGMPLNLKGQHAQKAEEVQEFIERLKSELDIEVVKCDERFTTTIAQKTMISMGTKKKERQKRDGRIDSMAASIMLQGFLDSSK
jgi:putative Holliday junction resolvase